jgi:hypothetical protein
MAECARCGGEFVQRRSDHRFCSRECRHLGERRVGEPDVDRGAVDRLFAEDRDPSEPVRLDDWYPGAGTEDGDAFAALDVHHTVAQRRRWYLHLRDRRVR